MRDKADPLRCTSQREAFWFLQSQLGLLLPITCGKCFCSSFMPPDPKDPEFLSTCSVPVADK